VTSMFGPVSVAYEVIDSEFNVLSGATSGPVRVRPPFLSWARSPRRIIYRYISDRSTLAHTKT
jgi:hypothetical protein